MTSKTLSALLAVAFLGLSVNAQAQMKIGYANVDYILSRMPELRQMETELVAFNSQVQGELRGMADAYQVKLETYQRDAATMAAEERQAKEDELIKMEREAKARQQELQSAGQQKAEELRLPIYNKLNAAIAEVAKENGFSHVLTRQLNGIGIVLYSTPEYDVSDLVLLELGITPPAE